MYEQFANLLDLYHVKVAEVSRATGIHPSTFSDWKSGKSKPKLDKMQKIADFFGVTVEYLMGIPADTELKVVEKDEAELLRIFRRLNDVGRARALESLEDMLQIPKYTDKSKESSISNAG